MINAIFSEIVCYYSSDDRSSEAKTRFSWAKTSIPLKVVYKLLLFLGKRQVYLMHLYEVSTGNEMRSYFKLWKQPNNKLIYQLV